MPHGVFSVSGLLGDVSCLRVAFRLPRIAGLTACRVADVVLASSGGCPSYRRLSSARGRVVVFRVADR